ncbi:zinc transporter ZIP13-like [Oppia nitens]|uniref:zinc transporter ZIP13-like n=1 Tax=Oppia nitens TaxID=1686743 RepID=UPI0023DB1DAF|nr:zinc transporter ZIP13-like [Oppia nitens]
MNMFNLSEIPQEYYTCESNRISLLISLGVGSLLGDVFFHLLPEAIRLSLDKNDYNPYTIGLWILVGIFTFVIIDVLINQIHNNNATENIKKNDQNNKIKHKTKQINGKSVQNNNNNNKGQQIEAIGYLNLIANAIDNFSHGLAVFSGFMVSIKTGFLTTLTIIIHEIPHEFADFAILLESGFSKWEAIRGQLITACTGICGSMFAFILSYSTRVNIEIWILTFTCGAFLNISLVNLLPKLLKEKNIKQLIYQILIIGFGIGLMAIINSFD